MTEPKDEDLDRIDLDAYRDLLEALEEHAAGRDLPRGMDRVDLLELARRVVVRR